VWYIVVWNGMGRYLRFNQHQIDKQHDKVMLDVFVREAFAVWALCEPDALA
jgi:hypothetical protein